MNVHTRPQDWEDPVVLPEVISPQRLLVPFDGSHNAERALAWAAHVSEREGAEVVVLVGFEQPLTLRGRGATYIDEVREQLEAEAKELAAELAQYPRVTDIRYAQDEPENQGAWWFVQGQLPDAVAAFLPGYRLVMTGVTRPASSAPSVGSLKVHQQQQEDLLRRALGAR